MLRTRTIHCLEEASWAFSFLITIEQAKRRPAKQTNVKRTGVFFFHHHRRIQSDFEKQKGFRPKRKNDKEKNETFSTKKRRDETKQRRW